MKNIDFRLKNINCPFAQGFSSFLMQNFAIFNNLVLDDYNGDGSIVRRDRIVVSDHEECDIGLMNVDTDYIPPEAKVVFCNAKTTYESNEFFFPYLQNARNENLQMDIFEKKTHYEKKYHCVAIFNSHTHPLRKILVDRLMDLCDIVVIDGRELKTQGRDINHIHDQWNIMRDSEFCICPPGHVSETYRFYEALRCHCIPLELNKHCKRLQDFSDQYIISSDLDRITDLEYSEEELFRVQQNIDREILLSYLVGKISDHGIG